MQQLAIQAAMRNQPIGALGTLAGITISHCSPRSDFGWTDNGNHSRTDSRNNDRPQTGQMTGTTTGQLWYHSRYTKWNITTNAFTNLLNSLLSNTTRNAEHCTRIHNQTGTNNVGLSRSDFKLGSGMGSTTQTPSLLQDMLSIGTFMFPKGLSDIRVKEDIQLVGHLFNGLNVYTFNYKGDPTGDSQD